MADPAMRRGVIMVASAGVFWSLQGLVIRMVEDASTEQVILWRSVGQAIVLLTLVTIISRGRVLGAFRQAGLVGVVGGACHMVASTCFVFALSYTTVANVVFMLAAAPLFASILAWLFMRERIPMRTLAAMLVALGGIGVMTVEGGSGGNLVGNLFALATTLGFAGTAVVARWGRGLSMLPATCWGASGTILFALVLTAR